MRRFVTGYRTGEGRALAVVCPGSLVEQWRAIRLCVENGAAIILQAANTGLTGGSTPDGDYSRDVVVINVMRLRGIHLLGDGEQVLCLPGARLHDLERLLAPIGREPHSVIGSSCIGASVIGGICNNSGGALVRRGPAYTELALYAVVDGEDELRLVNQLGIAIDGDPEVVLDAVERGDFTAADIDWPDDCAASAADYANRVRSIDSDTPARFNADPDHLCGASGSAGKVASFAVRLDTFPRAAGTTTFYIGTGDPAWLAGLRRAILSADAPLPIAAEYVHRAAFDLAAAYGKDMFLAIERLGTQRLPALFAAKARAEALLSSSLVERVMQMTGKLFPRHLPRRLVDFRDRYEHHLILQVDGAGLDAMRALLTAQASSGAGDFFECTAVESDKAFRHRFVVAGAAIRYAAVCPTGGLLALDIALPRNCDDWFERLPDEVAGLISHRIYYGHFLCHVLHQDYVLVPGADPAAVKAAILRTLDARGAQYPAEHNVGHAYKAAAALEAHYRALDPLNVFNPGIGQTSRERGWR